MESVDLWPWLFRLLKRQMQKALLQQLRRLFLRRQICNEMNGITKLLEWAQMVHSSWLGLERCSYKNQSWCTTLVFCTMCCTSIRTWYKRQSQASSLPDEGGRLPLICFTSFIVIHSLTGTTWRKLVLLWISKSWNQQMLRKRGGYLIMSKQQKQPSRPSLAHLNPVSVNGQSTDAKAKATAVVMLFRLFEFVYFLHFFLDLCQILAKMSLSFQVNDTWLQWRMWS